MRVLLVLASVGPWVVPIQAQNSAAAAAPVQTAADERAIRALIAQTEAANNAGDVAGWVALFEADAVYMPPDAPTARGRAELLDVARAGFSASDAQIMIVPDEIAVAGDMAFARSRVRGHVTLRADGSVVPIDMKQLVVYRRQPDGSWRIARMINNRNPAGDPPATQAIDSMVVVPGDVLVDPGRLVPHRATWRVTRRDPGGGTTVLGLWIDTWTRFTEDGQPVVVLRQLFVDTTGAVIADNEMVLDSATFRGVRTTQYSPPNAARASYRYAGDSAFGTFRRASASDAREFSVVFDEPVFEPLAPLSVVLPLEAQKSGTIVRYPIWNQTGPGGDVTWREVRVDSVGAVVVGGRAIEVRHVTVTVDAAPNVVTRLWQTREPPYYSWFAVERPGLTRDWTLVDWESFVSPDRRER